MHALLVQFGFAAFFDQLSILALLLGAVVHDMGRLDLSGLTRCAGMGISFDCVLWLQNFNRLRP